MGFDFNKWGKIAAQVANDVMNGNGAASERGRVEHLCKEAGLKFHCEGDAIVVPFTNYSVFIYDGDERLVRFYVYHPLSLSPQAVGADLMAYLLQRNSKNPLGHWSLFINSRKQVVFPLQHITAGGGLDAELLKLICQQMLSEVALFDDEIQSGRFA